MKPIEKPGPFPFRDPPNVKQWYPEEIVIPETLKPSPIKRRNRLKEKASYDIINISAENEVQEGEEDNLLSRNQVHQVVEYIKSCCYDDSTKEVTLKELEAAFRKHRYATTNQSTENYCRGLMESLDFLLKENNMGVEEWFRLADGRGTMGGDGKVTFLELIDSISKLCQNLDLPDWERQDALYLLRYMDPSADSDISLNEAKIAFRKFYSPPEYIEILQSATPIVTKLSEFMQKKHIRVIDLFRSIDSDSSNTISIDELELALLKLFGRRDSEGELSRSHLERIQEFDENISIGVDSLGSGWSKYNGIPVRNKPKIPMEQLHPKDKFKGYVNNNIPLIDYDDDGSYMSNLSDDLSYTSSFSKRGNKASKKQKPSIGTANAKNVRKLQPLTLSSSSLQKMIEIMKISGIDTESLDVASLSVLNNSSTVNITRVNNNNGQDNQSSNSNINNFSSNSRSYINNNSNSNNSNNNNSNRNDNGGSDNNTSNTSGRKHLDLFTSGYILKTHPLGLEGDSINVSGLHFQKRLKAEMLKHEETANRLRSSIHTGKNRLQSI